jgi:hypothetical protein
MGVIMVYKLITGGGHPVEMLLLAEIPWDFSHKKHPGLSAKAGISLILIGKMMDKTHQILLTHFILGSNQKHPGMTCISGTYPGVMELHLPTYPLVMTNSFLLKMATYSDLPIQMMFHCKLVV